MPALALVVGLLLVVAALGTHFRQHLIASLGALTYLMNWSRAFHSGPTDWLEHTWSLSIEEQYYLLWPLTLIAIYGQVGLKRAPPGALDFLRSLVCFSGCICSIRVRLRTASTMGSIPGPMAY